MTCEELVQTVLHLPANLAESKKYAWTEMRRRRRMSPQQCGSKQQQLQPQQRVISGMLPTLQALASLSCDSDIQKRGVCLVPVEGNEDAASHLHTTLLEAYCREIGLRLRKVPERALREAFGREHKDLNCLLVVNNEDAPFFLESPE